MKALPALILFLTNYDSACGLASSWDSLVAQAFYGPTAFDESEAPVKLISRRFARSREAYMQLGERDRNVLVLAFNDCPARAHETLRSVKGMAITFDQGEGTATNVALLTAWLYGMQPLQLLARHKSDPKSVAQMITNAVQALSQSINRFGEAYDALGGERAPA